MQDELGNVVDESLTPLVESLRAPNELLWLCAPERQGRITILFMDRQKLPEVRGMEALGLSAGMGRSFEVVNEAGEWKIVSEGSWIS